jgi:chemotaxis protein MotA
MAASVLLGGIYMSSDDPSSYLDAISFFIVFGGTIASTSISFNFKRLLLLLKIVLLRVMKGKSVNLQAIVYELIQFSKEYRTNNYSVLDSDLKGITDIFLIESIRLISDGTLTKDELAVILRTRSDNIYKTYMNDAKKFETISKFPTAFGMMGTTIGMIALLSKLGSQEAVRALGPSMSICMITTLYGVALTNLVVIPIAENLINSAKEVQQKNELIYKGIMMIYQKVNPIVMVEMFNSHLLPGDRIDWKEIS